MIEVLGAAGLLAFCVTSLAVGVRLLQLGRRTREIPEISIGAGFVVGVVVGYVPETIVLSTEILSESSEGLVLGATQVAIRFAALSILFFTWRVFRARSGWATCLAGLLTLALFVSYFGFPATRIHAVTATDRLWYDVFAVARTACLAWGAVESLVYFRGARRRMRLGLADPMVTNRFLLWGIGLGAAATLMGSTLWASALGIDPAVPGWVVLESLLGLVAAVPIWLTFFPSAAYRRLVTARAATSGRLAGGLAPRYSPR
jgi:hypothetical protein